jgi:hypothetical protein
MGRRAVGRASGDDAAADRKVGVRGRVARALRSPAPAVLLIAPFFGEALSGSTPPLDLVLPWNLALMSGLYGCGALICREVARRYGLGLVGLCLLGAAYGVYEEGLVDRYWYYPTFWADSGIGSYSVGWHTNVLVAVHLTVFHTAVSICSSILAVERLFPASRERAWVGRRGLGLAALILGVVVPFVYGEFQRGPGAAVLVAAGCLCVLLIVAALLVPRLRPDAVARRKGSGRGLAPVAFACTAAHFVAVYSVASTGVAPPIGIALALAPVAAGVYLVSRLATRDRDRSDELRVVTGILAFFILLDVVIGLGGRYDMIAGALATALGLRWLRNRGPQTTPDADRGLLPTSS